MWVVPLLENGSVALALIVAIAISAAARAPRRHVPAPELGRLLLATVILYAVGTLAVLDGHATPAIAAFAGGVIASAFAAWLSRGTDSDDPPGGGPDPSDRTPPPEPDGLPEIDWDTFERERRDWAQKRKPAVRV